jgi:hypothetical protein
MHMPQHLGPFGTSEEVAAPSAMPQLFFMGATTFFFVDAATFSFSSDISRRYINVTFAAFS